MKDLVNSTTTLVVGSWVAELPRELHGLLELALDLRWTWSHAGDHLWRMVDARAWEVTRNPWFVLQSLSSSRIAELAASRELKAVLGTLLEERRDHLRAETWYGQAYGTESLKLVAYFSMEFGLGTGLPLYAGGLGVLAGDFLKAASDMGVPIAGIGLLYHEGYFRQVLDADGRQIEAYPHNDSGNLPIVPVRGRDGGPLRVAVNLPGRALLLRVWKAQVGRVNLYLLDSNDPLNAPIDRSVTARLYEAELEHRLAQEIALGIGGWRMLEAVGLEADVCHMNEGHTTFAVLERARSFMKRSGRAFEEALWATRGGNVFTTHTPVAAGFDIFPADLIVRYFRDYADEIELSLDDLLSLGRADPRDERNPFNMGFLGARGSASINAVSRAHEAVSRRIFQVLFPRWSEREVPVSHVTNGVHAPSWDSPWADRLWTDCCGKSRWLTTEEDLCEMICKASDKEVWEMRSAARRALVEYARARLVRRLGERGADPEEIERAKYVLDPGVLTVGFGRRFTDYKRPNLVLHDPGRLKRILEDTSRPVQLVFAGKAHPRDERGKELIRELLDFSRIPELRKRVVFLDDYDITVAQELTAGVDVWINTPRVPWEACGTSGMKVLVNGGLNLSELDGWWAEAFAPGLGWAIGDGSVHPEADHDSREAQQLYEVLEQQVVPLFYERDAQGLPRGWLAAIRRSLEQLGPRFSTNRMMREYLERLYLPAARAFGVRAREAGRLATELYAWQSQLRREWGGLRFGNLRVEADGDDWRFRVEVWLGHLDPNSIAVELYADPVASWAAERVSMQRQESAHGAGDRTYVYEAAVPRGRPADHYTPRVIPFE